MGSHRTYKEWALSVNVNLIYRLNCLDRLDRHKYRYYSETESLNTKITFFEKIRL